MLVPWFCFFIGVVNVKNMTRPKKKRKRKKRLAVIVETEDQSIWDWVTERVFSQADGCVMSAFSGHTHALIVWIFRRIHPTRCCTRKCWSPWKRPALLALSEDFTWLSMYTLCNYLLAWIVSCVRFFGLFRTPLHASVTCAGVQCVTGMQ